jgi:hypothetical protein
MFRKSKKRVSAAQQNLEAAERSLASARADHASQAAQRAREQALMRRLDHLAAGNHLAELVLQALTERRRGGERA